MIFSVATIVAFVSRHATLKPGDVIPTGTPEGVLLGEKDPQWLKADDEVSVEIESLGRLTNRLIGRRRAVMLQHAGAGFHQPTATAFAASWTRSSSRKTTPFPLLDDRQTLFQTAVD
jgi:hypothetical protein